ncbi:hypothetical protein BVI1335_70144 [Burkholderia vietnamiensis]|nr:hypothetical protein BVI1335_70144 [Burkholderia vietnamiensis]
MFHVAEPHPRPCIVSGHDRPQGRSQGVSQHGRGFRYYRDWGAPGLRTSNFDRFGDGRRDDRCQQGCRRKAQQLVNVSLIYITS